MTIENICDRIEAIGYRVERWNIDGPPRWVTGPRDHGEVCYFRVLNQRFCCGFITPDGLVITRTGSFTIEQFEEKHRDDRPF